MLQRLYDLTRWNTLVQSFRLAIYNLSTLPTVPLLHLAMYAGLSSLKLPACYDPQTKNVDCPICDPCLGLLAKEVPFSHHFNSTIVCRLTGKIMDENNFPLAFPQHGHVYSKEVSVPSHHSPTYIDRDCTGTRGHGCKSRRTGNVPTHRRDLPLHGSSESLHFMIPSAHR